MPACTPEPADGLPEVVSGGQALAQAPEHSLVELLSFSNRYRLRPSGPTSTLPAGVVPRATEAPLLVGAEPVLLEELLELPQPAATSATSPMASPMMRKRGCMAGGTRAARPRFERSGEAQRRRDPRQTRPAARRGHRRTRQRRLAAVRAAR